MPGKKGRRHPLLVYQHLFGAWRAPALLIALGCGALWWWGPPPLGEPALQLALLAGCGVALFLFAYCAIGPRLSYVQCLPNHLLISTPLYRLAVSYRRIHTTRPGPFALPNVRPSRQWLVRPFRGQTALAVDLNGYPVARRFLRLWLNEFVLPAHFTGLLLLTPDWMALSIDIETFRAAWKTHRKDAGKDPKPLTSLSSRKY